MINHSPVFIAGAHKSGTSLLRSILDSHPALWAIPIETHYFQNVKYWVDNEYRRQIPEKINNKKKIDNLIKWIEHSNIANDPVSDSITTGLFDLGLFKEEIEKCDESDTDKQRIIKYFSAIYYSQYGKAITQELRVVEKSVENAEFAIELSQFFPQARFIHIIRNPYANFTSLKKYKSIKYGYPIIRRIIKTLYNNYYYMHHNKRRIKHYYILKYEDLLLNPRQEIYNLCIYLDIPYNNKLLEPTSSGNPWSGNSSYGVQFNRIDSSAISRWESEISGLEISYINKMFTHILNEYEYDVLDYNRLSFWYHQKGEDIKRYIANRAYYYFL